MAFSTVRAERYRWADAPGGLDSHRGDPYGVFILPPNMQRADIKIIATDGSGHPDNLWEHVSVSLAHRTPTWEEMSLVKALFWDAEDLVLQFHPPASKHVNVHPYCLHLWHPVGVEIPLPPSEYI